MTFEILTQSDGELRICTIRMVQDHQVGATGR